MSATDRPTTGIPTATPTATRTAAQAAGSSSIQDLVREIAHDLNGALNSLVLNIELLDALTVAVDGAPDAMARRTRSFAALRRAARDLQEIVERRLLPVGREAASDAGERLPRIEIGGARG